MLAPPNQDSSREFDKFAPGDSSRLAAYSRPTRLLFPKTFFGREALSNFPGKNPPQVAFIRGAEHNGSIMRWELGGMCLSNFLEKNDM